MTPAGTSNELDVQNEWEENTHTHNTEKTVWQLDRRRARGVLNPCARESKARSGRLLRESRSLTTVIFLPMRANKERRTGKIGGAFSGMHRTLDGWTLARVRTSPAQGLHHHGPRYFNFPYFCMTCGLGKLGLIDQNLLERDLHALLLRTLAVGVCFLPIYSGRQACGRTSRGHIPAGVTQDFSSTFLQRCLP